MVGWAPKTRVYKSLAVKAPNLGRNLRVVYFRLHQMNIR